MSVTAELFSKLQLLSPTSGTLPRRFDLGIDLDDFDPILTLVFVCLLTIGIIMVAEKNPQIQNLHILIRAGR